MLKRLSAFSIAVTVAVSCPSQLSAADPVADPAPTAAPADAAKAEKVTPPTVGALLKGKPTDPGYYLKYRQTEQRATPDGKQQGGQFIWQQVTTATDAAYTFTTHTSPKISTRQPPMATSEAEGIKAETLVTPLAESLLRYEAPAGVTIKATEDTLVRGEALTVGDRTYTCDHYTRTMTVANYAEAGTIVMHAWIDPALPLTGIAKRTSYLKSPREEIFQQLELLAYGTPPEAGTLPWYVAEALAAGEPVLTSTSNATVDHEIRESLQVLRSDLTYACLVGGELDTAIALVAILKKYRDGGPAVRHVNRSYAILNQDIAALDALGVPESERRTPAGDMLEDFTFFKDPYLALRFTGKYDELMASVSKPEPRKALPLILYIHNQLLGRPEVAATLVPAVVAADEDMRDRLVTNLARGLTPRAGDLVADPAEDWALLEAAFQVSPSQWEQTHALHEALNYLYAVDLREPGRIVVDRFLAAMESSKERSNDKSNRQFIQRYLEWLHHPRAAEFEAVLADKGYEDNHYYYDYGWPNDNVQLRRSADLLARKGEELAAEQALGKLSRLRARDYAPLVAARYAGGGSAQAFAWMERLAPKGDDKDFDVLAVKAQAATMIAHLAHRAGNDADTQRAVASAMADALDAEQRNADYNAAVTGYRDKRPWPRRERDLVSPAMLVAHMLVDLEDFANALAFVVQLPESKDHPEFTREVWSYIFLQAALADSPFVLDALLESLPPDFDPAARADMLILAAQALVHAGDPDAATTLALAEAPVLRSAMLRAMVIEHAFRRELPAAQAALALLAKQPANPDHPTHLAFAGLAVAYAQARAGQADAAVATATTSAAGLGNPGLSPHGFNERSGVDTTRKIAHVIAAAGPSPDALSAWLAAVTDPVQRAAVATGIAQGLAGVPIQVLYRVPDERRQAYGF